MAIQDYLRNGGINPQRPGQPAPVLEPPQPTRVDPTRQAVIDQLAPAQDATAGRTGVSASSPAAAGPVSSRFSRGGEVKQLPSNGGQLAEQAARTGLSVAGTAAGAFNPVTIGTNFAADKLKVKEEMPTFGGEFGHLTDDYGRRFEGTGGGLASNAVRYAGYGAMAGPIGAGVGALVGLAKGALTKNAPSAYTDFRAEDAADAIGKAYQEFLGRPASDEEIATHMTNVGWNEQGGDRWMGEKPLNFILGQIKTSPEAQQRATRGAVVDQLGSGESGTADLRNPDAVRITGSASGATGSAAPTTSKGSAPAPAAAGAAPDASGWDTDGYAAPAFTAPKAGSVPDGWDATKWNDANHQTPKYAVGRILSQFPPTVAGLSEAFSQIEQAYPGATFNGKDKITLPGVGTIDVLKGASKGGEAWRWGAEDGGASGAQETGAARTGGDPGARGPATVETDAGTLAQIRAELERIIAGQPSRDALLSQMGS